MLRDRYARSVGDNRFRMTIIIKGTRTSGSPDRSVTEANASMWSRNSRDMDCKIQFSIAKSETNITNEVETSERSFCARPDWATAVDLSWRNIKSVDVATMNEYTVVLTSSILLSISWPFPTHSSSSTSEDFAASFASWIRWWRMERQNRIRRTWWRKFLRLLLLNRVICLRSSTVLFFSSISSCWIQNQNIFVSDRFIRLTGLMPRTLLKTVNKNM